jgi:glycerol-3-phosphate dehydrogenase
VAVSYAQVEGLVRDRDGEVAGAVIRDLESGATKEVRANVVVNATGVWGDEVRAMGGATKPRLRPSRGSHLLFPRHRLPLGVAVTALSPDDGRPVFSVPHPEGTLVGTTDLFHTGPLDDPRPSAEEADYLLRFAQHVFPAARLRAEDVSGAFAGVRPVLSSHAETPSGASREEAVWVEQGLVSTAGGKLTTFRATAEKVVNTAAKLLPDEVQDRLGPPQTAGVGLPWRGDPTELRRGLRAIGAGDEVAQGLARRLGALALPAAAANPEAVRPVAEGLDLCGAELLWQLRFGGVVHLEDLLLRRVRLGMWQPRLCLEIAPSLRPLLRRAAGWTVSRWNSEMKRLERAVANWLPLEAK